MTARDSRNRILLVAGAGVLVVALIAAANSFYRMEQQRQLGDAHAVINEGIAQFRAQDEVLKLNNEFKLTFFADNTLYEKTFLFKKNTIKESALRTIKILENKKGIVVK